MNTVETKALVDKGLMLPLMERFYTIQGEGYYKGAAAYFVRIGGCDVGCHWCDVKESWNPDLHPAMDIEEIAQKAISHCKLVVITGGEPLTYDMGPLTALLKEKGARIHIETSGAYPFTGVWDWVCLSPKKNKLPVAEAYQKADELKMVIYNKHDFIFAEEQASQVGKDCILYLQPEWSKRKKMMPLIVDYVLANPQWQVSLQTHKYLNVP